MKKDIEKAKKHIALAIFTLIVLDSSRNLPTPEHNQIGQILCRAFEDLGGTDEELDNDIDFFIKGLGEFNEKKEKEGMVN